MATMARDGRAVGGWLLVAALSFVLLPWYFLADQSVLQSLPGVWGAADSASGAVQAAVHGRRWLWIAPIGIALALFGWRASGRRRQGEMLCAGALVGVLGLLAFGFAIGATGWSIPAL